MLIEKSWTTMALLSSFVFLLSFHIRSMTQKNSLQSRSEHYATRNSYCEIHVINEVPERGMRRHEEM